MVKTMAPRLLDIQALDATEQQATETIGTSAHQARYTTEVADKLQNTPIFFLFQGKDWTNRLGVAIGALMAALIAGLLIFLVAISLLALKVGFLLLLILAPVFLLIGVHPGSGRIIAMRWVEMVIGTLLRQAVLALVLGVLIYGYALIISMAMPWGMQVMFMALLTIAVFFYRRPFQHLFSSMDGHTLTTRMLGEAASAPTLQRAAGALPPVAAARAGRWGMRKAEPVLQAAAIAAAPPSPRRPRRSRRARYAARRAAARRRAPLGRPRPGRRATGAAGHRRAGGRRRKNTGRPVTAARPGAAPPLNLSGAGKAGSTTPTRSGGSPARGGGGWFSGRSGGWAPQGGSGSGGGSSAAPSSGGRSSIPSSGGGRSSAPSGGGSSAPSLGGRSSAPSSGGGRSGGSIFGGGGSRRSESGSSRGGSGSGSQNGGSRNPSRSGGSIFGGGSGSSRSGGSVFGGGSGGSGGSSRSEALRGPAVPRGPAAACSAAAPVALRETTGRGARTGPRRLRSGCPNGRSEAGRPMRRPRRSGSAHVARIDDERRRQPARTRLRGAGGDARRGRDLSDHGLGFRRRAAGVGRAGGREPYRARIAGAGGRRVAASVGDGQRRALRRLLLPADEQAGAGRRRRLRPAVHSRVRHVQLRRGPGGLRQPSWRDTPRPSSPTCCCARSPHRASSRRTRPTRSSRSGRRG
ncbi:type IV secretion system protein [Streptosporangium lutulentum]